MVCRYGSYLALPWLWHRLAGAAPSLGASISLRCDSKKKKKQKKKEREGKKKRGEKKEREKYIHIYIYKQVEKFCIHREY